MSTIKLRDYTTYSEGIWDLIDGFEFKLNFVDMVQMISDQLFTSENLLGLLLTIRSKTYQSLNLCSCRYH